MSSEVAVSLRGISMRFSPSRQATSLRRTLARAPAPREIQALQGVGFDVHRGENFGILGHNGAGKSTLLRILCGVLEPDSGEVTVRGRIAPVIALQAGFRIDFTGRENVFLKGAVMGLPKERRSRRGLHGGPGPLPVSRAEPAGSDSAPARGRADRGRSRRPRSAAARCPAPL